MIIRCWGARGSVPVSGEQYIKYGGDTPCIELRTKNNHAVVIDCGTGIRRLGKALVEEQCSNFDLILTHSHWDHIIGFPFFRPIYEPSTNIRVFGCPTAQGNIEKLLSRTMQPPNFPVLFDSISARIHYQGVCAERFVIDSMTIETIPLSHPNKGLGYKFTEGKKTFVFLTDNELGFIHKGGRSFEEYMKFCRGADLLIHDAEYTVEEYVQTRSWGHSTYMDALRLAAEAQVEQLGLYHHNQDRSDSELDSIVQRCSSYFEKEKIPVRCFAPGQNTEIIL